MAATDEACNENEVCLNTEPCGAPLQVTGINEEKFKFIKIEKVL